MGGAADFMRIRILLQVTQLVFNAINYDKIITSRDYSEQLNKQFENYEK